MLNYLVTFLFLIPMVYQDLKLRMVNEGYLIALYLASILTSAMLFREFGVLIICGIVVFAVHRKLDPKESLLGSGDMILIMCLINLFSVTVIQVLGVSLMFAYLYTQLTGKEDIPFFGCILCGTAIHLLIKEVIIPSITFTM